MFFAWHDSSMLIFRTHYKEFQDWLAQDVNFQEYWSKQLTKIISHGEYKNIYSRFKKHLIHVLTWRLLHVEILPLAPFPRKLKPPLPVNLPLFVFVKIGHFQPNILTPNNYPVCLFPFSIELAINPFLGGPSPGLNPILPINYHLQCFTELYAVINPWPKPKNN